MRKHRAVQFVAILIFIVAAAYLVLGLIGASLIGRMGVGAGWSSGWRGWLTIPVLVGTIFGFATLTVFGAVLFFLAKIDTNLTLAKQRKTEARRNVVPAPEPAIVGPAAIAVPVAAAAVIAPELTAPVAEVAVEAVPPEAGVIAAETEAELPEAIPSRIEGGFSVIAVELPDVELPALPIEVEAPAVALPDVELPAPPIGAELPTAAGSGAADELAALRVEREALYARIADLEGDRGATGRETRLTAPALEVPAELDRPEASKLAASARLPGADEMARIAAEMAALKPAVQPKAEIMPPATPDDLLQIVGIGPVFTERLAEAGLTTFRAIAEASDEFLAQVTNTRPGRVQSAEWRKQARRLGNLD